MKRSGSILLLISLSLTGAFFAQSCDGKKTGIATAHVVDIEGRPIVGAKILSSGFEGVTGSGGYLSSEKIPEGSYQVEARADGFAPSYHRIKIRAGVSTMIVFHLLPVRQQYVEVLSKGVDFKVGALQLKIPSGAIDSTSSGVIEVASIEPGKNQLNGMPGEFDGDLKSGSNVSLETAGAASIRILDMRNRELQPRKPLSVNFPYKGKLKAKEKIPLWSFDTKTGSWKEEGAGIIVAKGEVKYVETQLNHLSWWNLDHPISDKTSVWVKSFVNDEGEPLFTPSLSGVGQDYDGISFPYESYAKFDLMRAEKPAGPVLAGVCIDVKLGSKILLRSGFYGSSGVFEISKEMQVPSKSSSCVTNPQDGVVIERLQLARVPSSCVRGRVAFRNATSKEFKVAVYAAPNGHYDSYWNRPTAIGVSGSDGRFCIDHLPSGQEFTFDFYEPVKEQSSWSFFQSLGAQVPADRRAGTTMMPLREDCPLAKSARIELKTSQSQGFRCDRDYDRCTDLGEIQGELQNSCRHG